MVIKRFDGADKAEPKPEAGKVNTESMFTPFKPKEDKRRSALGERVYSKDIDPQEGLAEAEAELKKLSQELDEAAPTVTEIMMLHSRMMLSPNAATMRAFTQRLSELVKDEKLARGVLAMTITWIAHLQSRMGK